MNEINFDDFEEVNEDDQKQVALIKDICLRTLSIIEKNKEISHPNLPEALEFMSKALLILEEIHQSQNGSEKSRGKMASKELILKDNLIHDPNFLQELDNRRLTPNHSLGSHHEIEKTNPLDFLENFITPELNKSEENYQSKTFSKNAEKMTKSKELDSEKDRFFSNKEKEIKGFQKAKFQSQNQPKNEADSQKISNRSSKQIYNIDDFETHYPTIPTQRKESAFERENHRTANESAHRSPQLLKKLREFRKLAENSRGNFHEEQAKKKLDYYFESLRAINNLHKQMNGPKCLENFKESYNPKKAVFTPSINRDNYKEYFDNNFLSHNKGRKKSPFQSFEERISRKKQTRVDGFSLSPFSKAKMTTNSVSKKLDSFHSNFNRNKLLINFKLFS